MLLFAPLLYISGMLLYMGSVSFDVVSLKNVVVITKRSPPGSLYRSPQVFQKLWPYMQQPESNHTHNLVSAFASFVPNWARLIRFGD